ncbi:gluconate kinase [Hahella sp. CCB-MM4]|uniref:gluconokinase n=1 Tax=Hahella sp. (strain CCB-MM4) TaxID=1926491 RepID=UPI000BC768F5|nr:gluconokinase [Hahella sp. CCB-MM4]OZG74166.1 gluconate kinase [Hahella sp. CCB-MM4]
MESNTTSENPRIVVMGVSGSGKTHIGQCLARKLSLQFFDADDFHSDDNVHKMSQGIPLTDSDRVQWLADLADLIHRTPGLVLACSALKPEYRNTLRNGNDNLVFIYLKGDFDTIMQRLSQREEHYFRGRQMLVSQFETLVEPTTDEAVEIDIQQSVEDVVNDCLKALKKCHGSRTTVGDEFENPTQAGQPTKSH